jgi:glycosyltransferase involved in cell wall biosynthesis
MKVLQLCHKPPQPSVDGGCIAINNITKGFIENGVDVKVLTISTKKHPFDKKHYSDDYQSATNIESVFVDTKINLVDAFSSLITSDSYNISRFFSTDFDILLRKTLEANVYDIIHLESLFMTPYAHTIRRFSTAKIVLRSHNLEYMIWQRLSVAPANPAKKVYLKILAQQLKKYETNVFSSIDGIASISSQDQNKYIQLGCKKPMVTIPFGISLKAYSSKYHLRKRLVNQLQLFHIGAMDWKPNMEGVSWFIEEVWPSVLKENPDFELHIAGRAMPNWLIEKEVPGMINHTEVESAQDFMLSNDIMVVPLLSAGGMRVKIIEGMALGRVIISTEIGAEGIDYKDGDNILIANNAKEFNDKLSWLKANPKKLYEIGQNGKKLVETYYNNQRITEKLLSFYDKVLGK